MSGQLAFACQQHAVAPRAPDLMVSRENCLLVGTLYFSLCTQCELAAHSSWMLLLGKPGDHQCRLPVQTKPAKQSSIVCLCHADCGDGGGDVCRDAGDAPLAARLRSGACQTAPCPGRI
jgi:hypothetical protein